MMSLRGVLIATKQSPNKRGDCFAIARNDMWELEAVVTSSVLRTSSPLGKVGGVVFFALMPNILDKASQGEL
jgi:hypothetical protein